VELDNSQTEICGVELEVEWSLWSGAEVFGVELSQTAPKLRAVRSVGDAEGWVWFFQKESELCVPPFEHVNVGHLIRELDGHDQIAIVIRLYYY
jgi:hypothetical protein